jgi:hypothetical protein
MRVLEEAAAIYTILYQFSLQQTDQLILLRVVNVTEAIEACRQINSVIYGCTCPGLYSSEADHNDSPKPSSCTTTTMQIQRVRFQLVISIPVCRLTPSVTSDRSMYILNWFHDWQRPPRWIKREAYYKWVQLFTLCYEDNAQLFDCRFTIVQ